jgi:lipopolysaccharide/colanic/teichoic acid biosynthesis glycosyltransferase
MNGFVTFYRLRINPFLKRWNILNILLSIIDVLSIALAFQGAYLINNFHNVGFFFSERYLLSLMLVILPFWLLILYLIKFTQIPTKRHKVLIILYLHSSLVVLFLLILFCFILKLFPIPLKLLMEVSFLGFLFLFLVRLMEYKVFKNYGNKRHIHRKVVIIADDSSLSFIENLLSKKELAYKIVVIFTQSVAVREKYDNHIIVLPEKYLGILVDLIEVDLIDEVFFLKDKVDPDEVRETVSTCEELGVTFSLQYNDFKFHLSSAIRTTLANGNFLSFINLPYHSYALAIKKTTDINMSLLMIVLLSPIFVIIGALIKLTSPGPIINKQEGVGWKGRPVILYKFRTDNINSSRKRINQEFREEINSKRSKIKANPGISKIGKFLVISGLDHLPQLFNVLKGEVSIIGSRHPQMSDGSQQTYFQKKSS